MKLPLPFCLCPRLSPVIIVPVLYILIPFCHTPRPPRHSASTSSRRACDRSVLFYRRPPIRVTCAIHHPPRNTPHLPILLLFLWFTSTHRLTLACHASIALSLSFLRCFYSTAGPLFAVHLCSLAHTAEQSRTQSSAIPTLHCFTRLQPNHNGHLRSRRREVGLRGLLERTSRHLLLPQRYALLEMLLDSTSSMLTCNHQIGICFTSIRKVDLCRNVSTAEGSERLATVMSSACALSTVLTRRMLRTDSSVWMTTRCLRSCNSQDAEPRRCNCGHGMPCTCAAKRDIDVDDLPKAAARNLTHRRVHSHGSKPVMANRRSDSNVTRNQLGPLHPPIPQLNNAGHEYGPYQMKRFTTSTPNINVLGNMPSDDSLPLTSMPRTPPASTRSNEMSTSVPTSGWAPPQVQSQPQSYQPSPVDGFRPTFLGSDLLQPDTNFMNNALSPGNPARYSMNDFSKLQWPNFNSSGMYSNPTFATSADQLGGSNYSDWGLDTPQYSQGNTAVQTPQNRLSVASIDQPALSHSPSNTVSEAGSSVYPNDNTSYPDFGTQPPQTINPSFTSKDYFGLDPVSENMGDMPSESFAYQPEGNVNMDDLFSGEPGPTEPIIKAEPEDFSMTPESFATPEQFTSSGSGPSLVVPQFNNDMGTTSSYIQYPGPTTAGHHQPQQFYDPPMDQQMTPPFGWDLAQQSSNMS